MSLVQERKIKSLEKHMAVLENKLNTALDVIQQQFEKVETDKEMITKVLHGTMENYLRENVEFHMSVDGQIREILKDAS